MKQIKKVKCSPDKNKAKLVELRREEEPEDQEMEDLINKLRKQSLSKQ